MGHTLNLCGWGQGKASGFRTKGTDCGLHKMRGIYWLAEQLLASQGLFHGVSYVPSLDVRWPTTGWPNHYVCCVTQGVPVWCCRSSLFSSDSLPHLYWPCDVPGDYLRLISAPTRCPISTGPVMSLGIICVSFPGITFLNITALFVATSYSSVP